MLLYLDEPAKTVVAVAALTGLRLSELRGLRWSDYDGESLRISRSIWRTHVSLPKTSESEASIPVLPELRIVLDRHRDGASDNAYIFAGKRRGQPLNLANLARRVIQPRIAEHGIPWLGWHAFRRGLATNLYSLGIPPRIIQGILRHASVSTTMAFYVQSRDPEMREAMKKLEDVLAPFGI
jgi:integrase